MKLSATLLPFAVALTLQGSDAQTTAPTAAIGAPTVAPEPASTCTALEPLPVDANDYGEPNWKAIIEIAFPPWDVPAVGCPRLDKISGALQEGYTDFPVPVEGKFNPCYYTKAFAGLDPMKGGYPTPIDTKYHYEFAAPFFGQPGDGSTHHCPMDASPDTPVQSCPKVAPKCDDGSKDCNKITDEFGIGHVPPFVALAAVKNGLKELSCQEEMCAWFADDVQPCNIAKSVLDTLVHNNFADSGNIKFTPPKILEDLPAGDPKSTYYKLEYLDDPEACADDNCRGPHYCSKEAAEADIWGDFCPYIHTGENSGQYRHPHLALAATELWLANKCNPSKCPSTWLDSPNGMNYGKDPLKSTSITWSEMIDNNDPMSQPIVPYKWPNSGNGIYPGHELYGGKMIKPSPGLYVTQFSAPEKKKDASNGDDSSSPDQSSDDSAGYALPVHAVATIVAAIAFWII